MKRRPRPSFLPALPGLPPAAAAVGMAAVLLALLAAPAAAQEIAGMAVDEAGQPLPQVPVALHRVGDGTGSTVATASTDGDGRFRFAIDAADSAVYFVAMRHGEAMYIGPPVRGGTEPVAEYRVRADPGSEVGAVMSALSGGGGRPIGVPPGVRSGGGPGGTSGAGAVGLVALLGLAVAVMFVTTAPGYRRRQRRMLLIELARLENRLDGSDEGSGAANPDEDRRRRDALRARLAPRT